MLWQQTGLNQIKLCKGIAESYKSLSGKASERTLEYVLPDVHLHQHQEWQFLV